MLTYRIYPFRRWGYGYCAERERALLLVFMIYSNALSAKLRWWEEKKDVPYVCV